MAAVPDARRLQIDAPAEASAGARGGSGTGNMQGPRRHQERIFASRDGRLASSPEQTSDATL